MLLQWATDVNELTNGRAPGVYDGNRIWIYFDPNKHHNLFMSIVYILVDNSLGQKQFMFCFVSFCFDHCHDHYHYRFIYNSFFSYIFHSFFISIDFVELARMRCERN